MERERREQAANWREHLLVVSGDAGNVVASVGRIFDIEAGLAGDAVASDSSQQFCAFARKHRTENQLEEASELRLEVLARRQFLLDRQTTVHVEVALLTEGLLQFQLLGHGGSFAHSRSLELFGERLWVRIAILLHALMVLKRIDDFNICWRPAGSHPAEAR